MKRKKFLFAALIASTALMGLGYAAWTDSLTITNKATSGNLKVRFIDISEYGQYPCYAKDNEVGWAIFDGRSSDGKTSVVDGVATVTGWRLFDQTKNNPGNPDEADTTLKDAYLKDKEDYQLATYELAENYSETDKLPIDLQGYKAGDLMSDKIDLTIDNIYPGYAQLFQADIVNVGTVRAKLSGINAEFGKQDDTEVDTKELANMLGIALLTHDEQNVTTEVLCVPGVNDENIFEVGGVKFLRLSALNDQAIADALVKAGTIEIAPQSQTDRVDIYWGIAMDPDLKGVYTSGKVEKGENGYSTASDKDDAATQLKGVQLSLQFLWDQFNVNPDVTEASNEPEAVTKPQENNN